MENNQQNGALSVSEPAHIGGRLFSKLGKITYLKTTKTARSPVAAFAREIIRSPRLAGAVCPSGMSLSAAMAREAIVSGGLVVELGAGTGAVTEALLNRGIAPENIVAVEQSPRLADFLRNRFPCVNIIQGDACQLTELLDKPVDSIVSSLPVVSLSAAIRETIIEQIRLLASGKRLVQFTYFWSDSYLTASGLKLLRSQMVFKNFPPARVMTFEV